ncbi:hypothetical protein N7466_004149 [Penicillium verhagenii]|uniref:uncharacterized protein n=1 Tax=Penicillium verhagenii TaxID=1562060 RepID=UPI0025455AA2|nr:uncharacterized protein N7466_004149 [Penicillium verhagenii]KAJ5934602.1 hypothetical protein N7466_004149 [Penicillium verhagenii]
MSGSVELRWRGPSRQSSQRHSGNGNRDRAAGGQGGQGAQAGAQGGPQQNASQSGNNAWGGSGPAQDLHVSVRGFNAAEAKNILKRETKPTFYKPTGKDTNNQRSGGPWGAKSNTMANGKDFFIELRKQVASLQKGVGPPVGG